MKIALLGAGNMGAALLGGVLGAGIVKTVDVRATTGTEARAADLRSRLAIDASAGGNAAASAFADIIILAVKPPATPKVVREIRESLRPNQILISLAAALPLHILESAAGIEMPIFRAMPNLPVVVGEGAIGICHNRHASAADRESVDSLFRAVGVTAFVEEDQMDAVTALSGSGPAYIYMVIEAMMAAGLKMGLSREVSLRLAEQTVLGAARHAKESKLHPAVLRDQVITPAGTTITAIHELERHGLRSMLISAIEAATRHAAVRSAVLVAQLEEQAPK